MIRLQKILSAAGVASRRTAETLISQGRVTVNGETVTELGTKADPAADEIKVDGRRLPRAKPNLYLLLNKPRGYITSRSDPKHRPTVIDLLAAGGVRDYIYPVGRLDYDSEGLLLLTSDGELAARLTHPRHGVAREYRGPRSRRARHARARATGARRDDRRPAHGDGAGQDLARLRVGLRAARHPVARHPRRAQPAGAEDVRRDRASGRAAAARPDWTDFRRSAEAGPVQAD